MLEIKYRVGELVFNGFRVSVWEEGKKLDMEGVMAAPQHEDT